MDRLTNLRKSRESASSVFTQIINLYKRYDTPLFCCFEGEDFKYYGIRIEMNKEKEYDRIIPLKCGGKKEVIKLFNLVNKEDGIREKTFLYFVDKDFDPTIKDGVLDIYETPTYSIENFYTSQAAFEKILINELKIAETDKNFDYCIAQYLARQADFHSEIRLLNSWIKAHRLKENPDKRLNISSFKLSKMIKEFNLDRVEFHPYTIQTLKEAFPDSIEITEPELLVADLTFTEPREQFRGKFELDFLYKFLVELLSRINKKEAPFEAMTKIRVNLSRVNILSEICQYACTPSCLLEYIKKSA